MMTPVPNLAWRTFLADTEACVGLRLFVVVEDFVPLYGGLACVAVAVVGGFFDGQVVQYFGRDFFDEAGDDAELGLSVQHALLRHGDVEAFAGAGDGDVHEAAFFFEATAFGKAHFAGEAAFFHAGEEDGVIPSLWRRGRSSVGRLFRLRLLGFRQIRGRRC